MDVFILANENVSIKPHIAPPQALLLEPHCLMKWVKKKKNDCLCTEKQKGRFCGHWTSGAWQLAAESTIGGHRS